MTWGKMKRGRHPPADWEGRELAVLSVLVFREKMGMERPTYQEMGKESGIGHGAVIVTLQRLEAKGMVTRFADKRPRGVKLTDKGRDRILKPSPRGVDEGSGG